MKISGRISLMAVVLVFAGCAQAPPAEPPDTRAADEAAIRAAVKEWASAAQDRDAEKFMSFYSEDPVLMVEDAPDVAGKAALREGIVAMMTDPNFALSFETTRLEVARSGDLAYETGSYSFTMTNPETKKPATEKGHYIVVWKKQADGAWKAHVDAPISDPPEATAAK